MSDLLELVRESVWRVRENSGQEPRFLCGHPMYEAVGREAEAELGLTWIPDTRVAVSGLYVTIERPNLESGGGA